jgi:hypothetical protein
MKETLEEIAPKWLEEATTPFPAASVITCAGHETRIRNKLFSAFSPNQSKSTSTLTLRDGRLSVPPRDDPSSHGTSRDDVHRASTHSILHRTQESSFAIVLQR